MDPERAVLTVEVARIEYQDLPKVQAANTVPRIWGGSCYLYVGLGSRLHFYGRGEVWEPGLSILFRRGWQEFKYFLSLTIC